MLVSFSATNFRSFADDQQLSMSAGRFKSERVGAVIDTGIKSAPHLLRVVALMGANGSGKSNLIKALTFVQWFVSRSAQSTQQGDRIDVEGFRLDAGLCDEPSSFEIVFIYKDIEYHYSFSATKLEVVNECLISRQPKRQMREVFSRCKAEGKVSWNTEGLPKAQAKLWIKSTRSNALFLSTAVQLNAETLRAPFEWLSRQLRIQEADGDFFPGLTAHLIKEHEDEGYKSQILNLLREADLGITDVQIDENDFEESNLRDDVPEDVRKIVATNMKDEKILTARFEHRTRQLQKVFFEFEDESDGTQRLFEMAGPWVAALRFGHTLVVDEIDNSLHPLLVRLLISLFQNREDTESGGQLLFTTHDVSLLDNRVLEHDQVWFVEKRRGASALIPLLEYKPRRGEAIGRNYLRGRYGGIPSIARVER